MIRLVLLVLVAAAAAASAAAGDASAETPHVVRCNEIIDRTAFPYLGRPPYRFRTVLGAFSAPPAYLETSHHPGAGAWPYFAKIGLVVRELREPVTVTVPRAWRSRVRIGWGNADGVYASLRILGCGSDPARARVYAGGFALRTRGACVPLVFRVGVRSQTVRFGVGRRCR